MQYEYYFLLFLNKFLLHGNCAGFAGPPKAGSRNGANLAGGGPCPARGGALAGIDVVSYSPAEKLALAMKVPQELHGLPSDPALWPHPAYVARHRSAFAAG